MTTEKINSIRQLQAFAHIDGGKMALLWVASFACFILQFTHPLLGLVWLASLCSIPVATFIMLRTFRDKTAEGPFSFGRGWMYVTYTFFYATLLFALAQYVYFAFIDNGYIIDQYVTILSDQTYQAAFKAYGYSDADLKTVINQMYETRPISMALNFASLNFMFGMVLGLPLAALTKRNANVAGGGRYGE